MTKLDRTDLEFTVDHPDWSHSRLVRKLGLLSAKHEKSRQDEVAEIVVERMTQRTLNDRLLKDSRPGQ